MNWELVRDTITRLLELRGGMSHTALAELCGVPQPTISRFLSGTHAALSVDSLAAIAAALDVSVGQLLGETPLQDDPKIARVVAVMQRLPEYKKDAIVQVSNSFDEPNEPAAKTGS
jgi:transcriptional regulator with XRE-family HTH domain